MTKAEFTKACREYVKRGTERLADIDVWKDEAIGYMATVVTISKHHCVWKYIFTVDAGDNLKVDTYLMTEMPREH